MKYYSYKSIHKKTGKIQKGKISASSENELSYFLKQLDFDIIDVKEIKKSVIKRINKQQYVHDLIELCSNMHDMLSSGVTFEDAFSLCSEAVENRAFRDVLRQITQDIISGNNVCRAFSKYPYYFDVVFISILEAGEISGDLSKTFYRLNKHLSWQYKVSNQIIKSIRYPVFLLFLALSVVTFMLSFVLPQLIEFLSNLSYDLPLSTRILIGSANLFSQIWFVIPIVIIIAIITAFFMKRFSKDSEILLDKIILSLPMFGNILQKFALARLMTSLSLLVKSGLSLSFAFEIAIKSLGRPYLEEKAQQSSKLLLSGCSFSSASAIIFPPVISQMLKVGEKSSKMSNTLDKVAKSLERQAQESVDQFLGALEPSLTILVGGIMAWIVLAILGPVYNSLIPLSQ